MCENPCMHAHTCGHTHTYTYTLHGFKFTVITLITDSGLQMGMLAAWEWWQLVC